MQEPELLPSGRFRGIARDPHYRHPRTGKKGKRYTKAFDTFVEAAGWAEAEERRILAAYAGHGIDVTRQRRDIPLFGEWVIEWAKTVGGTPSSRANVRSQARQLKKRWPHERVDVISRRMVEALMTVMEDDGLTAGTREQRLSVLRRVMAAAIEDGHRSDNPTRDVDPGDPAERPHRILTGPELAALMAAMPPWLRVAVVLSHDAGLRIGEVAGLRWHRVNLLAGYVEVRDTVLATDGTLRPDWTKGGARVWRKVVLSARLLAALRAHHDTYPPGHPHGPVFSHPTTHGHLKTARIRDEFERARALAHDAKVLADPLPRWHDLRHCCATALARSGATVYAIMAILGHATLKTAQRYIDAASLGDHGDAIAAAFNTPQATEPAHQDAA